MDASLPGASPSPSALSGATILAIETSCDDTAAAVLQGGLLKSSVVASQRVHAGFGGVVPELASRAHQRLLVPAVEAALDEAGIGKGDIEAVAVTRGPGLAGALLVGLSYAKALAFGLGVPLVAANHLTGHLYSAFVRADAAQPVPPVPFVGLVVSGGHTLAVHAKPGFEHVILGKTRDDAAGEAFDKVAKMLGLGYPGGPVVDRLAALGNPHAHAFPSPRLGPLDLSFSGIKTSVLYHLKALPDAERAALLAEPNDQPGRKADLCASFQRVVAEALVTTLREAVQQTGAEAVCVVGGVAANSGLRAAAQAAADQDGFQLFVPPIGYCVDNAAMIAVAGAAQLAAGHTADLSVTIDPNLRIDGAA